MALLGKMRSTTPNSARAVSNSPPRDEKDHHALDRSIESGANMNTNSNTSGSSTERSYHLNSTTVTSNTKLASLVVNSNSSEQEEEVSLDGITIPLNDKDDTNSITNTNSNSNSNRRQAVEIESGGSSDNDCRDPKETSDKTDLKGTHSNPASGETHHQLDAMEGATTGPQDELMTPHNTSNTNNNNNNINKSKSGTSNTMALGCIPLSRNHSTISTEKSSCEYYDDHVKLEDGDLPSLRVPPRKIGGKHVAPVPVTPDNNAVNDRNGVKDANGNYRTRSKTPKRHNSNKNQPSPAAKEEDGYVTVMAEKLSPTSKKIHRAFWNQLDDEEEDEDGESNGDGKVAGAEKGYPAVNNKNNPAAINFNTTITTAGPKEPEMAPKDELEHRNLDQNSPHNQEYAEGSEDEEDNGILSMVVELCSDCSWLDGNVNAGKPPSSSKSLNSGNGGSSRKVGSGRKQPSTTPYDDGVQDRDERIQHRHQHRRSIDYAMVDSDEEEEYDHDARNRHHRRQHSNNSQSRYEGNDDDSRYASQKLTQRLRENERNLQYPRSSSIEDENYENTAIEVEYMGPAPETKSPMSLLEKTRRKLRAGRKDKGKKNRGGVERAPDVVPPLEEDTISQLQRQRQLQQQQQQQQHEDMHRNELVEIEPASHHHEQHPPEDVLSDVVPPTQSFSEFVNEPAPSDEKGGYILEKSRSWSAPEKTKYLRAMAEKAKEDFRRRKGLDVDEMEEGDNYNNNNNNSGDDEDSLEEILDKPVKSPVDWDRHDFTPMEKRRFMELINSEDHLSPEEATERILESRREDEDELANEQGDMQVIDLVDGESSEAILSNMQKKPGFNNVVEEDEVLSDSIMTNMRKKPGFDRVMRDKFDESPVPPSDTKQIKKRSNNDDGASTKSGRSDGTSTCSNSLIVGKKVKRDSKKSGGKWHAMPDSFEEDDVISPMSDRSETVPEKNADTSLEKDKNADIFTFDQEHLNAARSLPRSRSNELLSPLTPDAHSMDETQSDIGPVSAIHLNPYTDSCDVSLPGSMLGSAIGYNNNENMSVSSRSMYTTATNASEWSVSTRRRHRGAARRRLRNTNDAKSSEERPKGWVESMQAAAEKNKQKWDPKDGFVDYVEPEYDPKEKYIPREVRHLGKLKAPVLSKTNVIEEEHVDLDGDEGSEDNSVESNVPFPIKWMKDREEMVGGDLASAVTEVVSNRHQEDLQYEEDESSRYPRSMQSTMGDSIPEEASMPPVPEEISSLKDAAPILKPRSMEIEEEEEVQDHNVMYLDYSQDKDKISSDMVKEDTKSNTDRNLVDEDYDEDSSAADPRHENYREHDASDYITKEEPTERETGTIKERGILDVDENDDESESTTSPPPSNVIPNQMNMNETRNEEDRASLMEWIDGAEQTSGIFCGMVPRKEGDAAASSEDEMEEMKVKDEKDMQMRELRAKASSPINKVEDKPLHPEELREKTSSPTNSKEKKEVIDGNYLDSNYLRRRDNMSPNNLEKRSITPTKLENTSAHSDATDEFNQSNCSFDFTEEPVKYDVGESREGEEDDDDEFRVIQSHSDVPVCFKPDTAGEKKKREKDTDAPSPVEMKQEMEDERRSTVSTTSDRRSTVSTSSQSQTREIPPSAFARNEKLPLNFHLEEMKDKTRSLKVTASETTSDFTPNVALLEDKDEDEVKSLEGAHLVTDDVSAFGGDRSVQTQTTNMSGMSHNSMSSRAVEWRRKQELRKKAESATIQETKDEVEELREQNLSESPIFVSAIDDNSTTVIGAGSDSVFGNLDNDTIFEFDNATIDAKERSVRKERNNNRDKDKGETKSDVNREEKSEKSTHSRSRSHKSKSSSRSMHKSLPLESTTSKQSSVQTKSIRPPIGLNDNHTVASDITSATSGSTYGPKKSETFFSRLQSCAAPVMSRLEDRNDNDGDLPSAHLAFLRKSQSPTTSVTSSEDNGGHKIIQKLLSGTTLCGKPEVIEEEEEKEKEETPQKDKANGIASEYLEAIRSNSQKRSEMKAPSDIISPSGVNRSTRSQAWKDFIERRNNPTNSSSSVSSAEIYATKKIDEVLQNISQEEVLIEPAPRQSYVGGQYEVQRGRSNVEEERSTRSGAAKAAEDLAAARVEAMMSSTRAGSNLDIGEI